MYKEKVTVMQGMTCSIKLYHYCTVCSVDRLTQKILTY